MVRDGFITRSVCRNVDTSGGDRYTLCMNHRISDRTIWLVAFVLGVGSTAVSWAAGARLGAALTLGVILVIVTTLAGLSWSARSSTE